MCCTTWQVDNASLKIGLRDWKRGNEAEQTTEEASSVIAREKWVVDPITGCWLWQGAIDAKGYGRVYDTPQTSRLAHRIMYVERRGPVPDGLTLDHLCRVTHCVNPDHLEPVTHRENCLRGVGPIPENAAKTHCVHGHEFTPENTYWRAPNRRACKACTAKLQREYQARKRKAA